MFGWFKKKQKANIKSAQKQVLPIVVPQAPTKPISQITHEKKAESERLCQERQALQNTFDPYNLDLTNLDTSKLKPAEMQFLKKIANQPVENPHVAGYWEYEYRLKFPVIMTKLLGNGYLMVSSAVDNLEYLTISELKEILKANHVPVSGKKADLITRIRENVSNEYLLSSIGTRKAHYTLTEKGKTILSTVRDSITADYEFEDVCLTAIHQGDFNKTYRIIAKSEAGKQFPRGIGINWDKESRSGLSERELDFYSRILEGADGIERTYRECVILSYMLGVPNITPLIKRLCGHVNEELILASQYELKKSKSLLDIESYKDLEVQGYEILGADDDRMCENCRKMSGKYYLVSRAKIGVNFPPFCRECRCTTAPYYNDN